MGVCIWTSPKKMRWHTSESTNTSTGPTKFFIFERRRKLRQDLYTSKNPLAIPWFQLALFISMSKECQRLVGGYMKIKNSEGHSARKRACHQFQAAVLRSHYRFSSGLAGFSTMCTHAVISCTCEHFFARLSVLTYTHNCTLHLNHNFLYIIL